MFKQPTLLRRQEMAGLCHRILTLRYGFDLVEVSDSGGGRLRIEAFSRSDGCAYQCYSHQQALKNADLLRTIKRKSMMI